MTLILSLNPFLKLLFEQQQKIIDSGTIPTLTGSQYKCYLDFRKQQGYVMLVFDDCVIDQFSLCGVLLRSVNGLSNDHYLHLSVLWLSCNIFLNSRFFQLDLQFSLFPKMKIIAIDQTTIVAELQQHCNQQPFKLTNHTSRKTQP